MNLPRSFLRRVLWSFVIFACLLAAAGVFFGKHLSDSLTKISETLQAKGDPLVLADLARKVDPAKNAETLLASIEDELVLVDRELNKALENVEMGDRLTKAQATLVAKSFADHPQILPTLREASWRPDFFIALDYTLPAARFLGAALSAIQRNRAVARILNFESRRLAAEGQTDEAIERCCESLRLSRLMEKQPLLLAYLVAIASRMTAIETARCVLQQGVASPKALGSLDEALSSCDSRQGLIHAIKTERAYSASAIQDLSSAAPWYAYPMTVGLRYGQIHQFEFMTSILNAGSYVDVVALIQTESSSVNRFQILSKSIAGSMQSAWEANCRDAARIRTLRVLIAFQRLNEAERDKISQLSQLGPPVSKLLDPFDEKPLRFKRTSTEIFVYSVGSDLTDGGDVEKLKDVGIKWSLKPATPISPPSKTASSAGAR